MFLLASPRAKLTSLAMRRIIGGRVWHPSVYDRGDCTGHKVERVGYTDLSIAMKCDALEVDILA